MSLIPAEGYYWQWLGYLGRYGGQGKRDADLIPVNKMEQAIDGVEYWVKKEMKK